MAKKGTMGHRRRKPGDPELVKINVNLPPDLHQWLRDAATENYCSISYVVLRLVAGAREHHIDACQMEMPVEPVQKP